jgi:uncharacterized secreted repeat protein (TIGR03808 family)
VPGQTRLEFSGGPFLLRARDTRFVAGAGRYPGWRRLPFDESVSGLIDADGVDDLVLDDCVLTGSAGMGANLRDCAGRVEHCRVSEVGTVGLHVTQSRGMAVLDNVVSDCGNTGILVSRDDEGGDDTIVRGNRVSSIRARPGGTGQYGNGINISKANGVIVAGNRIDNCDFSAIRCFSSDNTQLSANLLTNSGEMAIYVEFAFEGAVVADNLIDGAAFGISMVNFAEHGGRWASAPATSYVIFRASHACRAASRLSAPALPPKPISLSPAMSWRTPLAASSWVGGLICATSRQPEM